MQQTDDNDVVRYLCACVDVTVMMIEAILIKAGHISREGSE